MAPTSFGPYIIIQALDSGGMADVYLANDTRLGRHVAVKAPREDLFDNTMQARFDREARAAAGLEHEAIVPIYDFGEQDGRPYMVMRYMTGGTLAGRLAAGPMSPAEALSVLRRVGAALDHAHAHGIIHRDVKSANILFDDKDDAYVADFGIAWLAADATEKTALRLTAIGQIHGTFAYISPEQATGLRELDGRSDVYSLGVALFEMLTGGVPYKAESGVQQAVLHVSAPIPQIRERRPELPATIQTVIESVLAKQPEDRYASCAALVADLERVAAGQPPIGASRLATPVMGSATPPAAPVAPAPVVATALAPAVSSAPAAAPALNKMWLAVAALAVVAISAALFALLRDRPAAAESEPNTIVEVVVTATAAAMTTEPTAKLPTAAATATAEPTPTLPITPEPKDRSDGDALPAAAGDEIVFQSNRDGDFEIYSMGVDGRNVRQLTDNADDDNFPRVSADGRRITFVSERDGNPEIYVMNRDGSEQTRLTADPAKEGLPAWSPDGKSIVFQSSRDGLMDIFVMDAGGGNVRQITDSLEREGHTSWSPDGQRLAYNASMERYWQLYVSNADGSDRRKITDSTYDEWSPEWSPDGEWLLFHSERDNRSNPGIYLMRPDGSDARLVYNGPDEEWGASWSADGTQIIFTVVQADESDNLYIMDADGGNVRLLAERAGYPSWAIGSAAGGQPAGAADRIQTVAVDLAAAPIPLSGDGLTRLTFGERDHYTPLFYPDQSRFLVSVEVDGHWQIYEADANGGGLLRQITQAPGNDFYQPELSPDGQTFLAAADLDGDGDIYLFDALTGEPLQQLTDNPGIDYHPRRLPDGSGFIFSSETDGDHDIYRSTFDGKQTQLTHNTTFDGFAVPSPDGQLIAFYAGRDGDYEIYVMDSDGGNPRRLTTSAGRDASPSFSPDGRWIVFESDRGGGYEIYATPLAGGAATRLTDSPGGNWAPVISPDGRWLMFQSDRDGYMDIYRQPWEKP